MYKNMITVTIAAETPGTVTLLQKGVGVRGTAGMSIREFIKSCVGFAPDYIEQRVRTVFLNNCPADDIDSVRVKDGDILSLSGALPGVAGMAMGRDTAISAFRSEISAKNTEDVGEGEILVTVKLFNLIAKEGGPGLLKQGVIVDAALILQTFGEKAPDGITADSGKLLLKTN
ncbi:hypothetical protein SAMN05660337_1839 [Maridesulfovibrio ferrireducens]|uniref:Uncharacterized protein n=1 Tax=Maridesulfovibrio ferrireducens TaxID=246191 RepID=A0A1G9G677_9BACT|nr:hypothetical protein [Maridesulfovibrio ferrireducens]SDK95803.1 hypothetical protein SAMN05660337_1839 [Maridesulfovibrio ferrireducens]